MRGALNLYAHQANAFDERARTLAGLFGVQAALVLYGANEAMHLQRAVDSRDLIGQAKGILMERFKVDDEASFQMRMRWRRGHRRHDLRWLEAAVGPALASISVPEDSVVPNCPGGRIVVGGESTQRACRRLFPRTEAARMLELPVALSTAATPAAQNRGCECQGAATPCPPPPHRCCSERVGPPAQAAASRAGADAAGEATRAGDATGGLVVAPVQPRRGQIVVRVQGEVDLATAPRLQAVLEQAIIAVATEGSVDGLSERDGAAAGVVCDLDAVTLLSAAGLAVLQQITALAAAHHVHWLVLASARRVRRVVELTGLDQVVPVRTTPADVAHVRASQTRDLATLEAEVGDLR
jgi:anti-anti-sigma factor